jgi:hypothetical protein
MNRAFAIMCIAAVLGVVAATSSTCAVGLLSGTGIWCGLPFVWIFGVPMAVVSALVLGIPLLILFRKFQLTQWWQYTTGGALASIPLWYYFAQPFSSPRWQASGFFDSLNYLGTGMFAGLFFWLLLRKCKDPLLSNKTIEPTR